MTDVKIIESPSQVLPTFKFSEVIDATNGNLFYSTSPNTIQQYNPTTKITTYEYNVDEEITGIAVLDNQLCIASGENIFVFDTQSQDQLRVLSIGDTTHFSRAQSMTLLNGFLFVASGEDDSMIRKMDFNTGDFVKDFKGHTNWVKSLCTDGEFVYSASYDKTLKKWTPEGQCVLTFNGHTKQALQVLIDGGYLFSCSLDGTTRQWNVNSGEEIKQFQSPQPADSGSYTLAVGGGSVFTSVESFINEFDIQTGSLKKSLQTPEKYLRKMVWSDGNLFSANVLGGSVNVWNL
eukprot:TRINITY_DN1512_c0_g1_i1.p1 TRINITY_DN1512_c0_g1~~TRINITY_DN1512_c0_g1_i1.p1  ORF type:complete len:291 (-),score=75.24 TRINITY_DN1512_c0_g1_i1:133-1005(-)